MFKQLFASLKYKSHHLNVDDSAMVTNIGDFKRQVPYRETEFYAFDEYLFAHLELERLDIDKVNN